MKKSNLQTNERGAVALITVSLVVLIFSIMILSFLRLALNERRQSTDSALSQRAFYAAESGLEDARAVLRSMFEDSVSPGFIDASERALLREDECALATTAGLPNPVISAQLDTEITCQLIDLSVDSYEATNAIENEPIFIPLIPSGDTPGSLSTVTIEWHIGSSGTTAGRNPSNIDFPIRSCWHSNEDADCDNVGTQYASLLQASIYSHPSSGTVNRANMTTQTAFLNPVSGPGAMNLASFGVDSGGVNDPNVEASCEEGSEYFCRLTINNFDGANNLYYLRITPLYRGTDLRVTLNDGALSFQDAQIKIDVTARVNDIQRRVEARIDSSYDGSEYLPDNAITTSDQLCKLISITGPNVANDECP